MKRLPLSIAALTALCVVSASPQQAQADLCFNHSTSWTCDLTEKLAPVVSPLVLSPNPIYTLGMVGGTLSVTVQALETRPGDTGVVKIELLDTFQAGAPVILSSVPLFAPGVERSLQSVSRVIAVDTTRYANGTSLGLAAKVYDRAGNVTTTPVVPVGVKNGNTLPYYCRVAGAKILCDTNAPLAMQFRPVQGVEGWTFEGYNPATASWHTLLWRAPAWIDALGGLTSINNGIGVRVDPARLLRYRWTPPRAIRTGATALVTIGAVNFSGASCTASTPVQVQGLNGGATLMLPPSATMSTQQAPLLSLYRAGVKAFLTVDVKPPAGSTCTSFLMGQVGVHYEADNLAPVLTRVTTATTVYVRAPLGQSTANAVVQFRASDDEEPLSALSFVVSPAGSGTIVPISPGVYEYRRQLPMGSTATVSIQARDSGGVLSNALAWTIVAANRAPVLTAVTSLTQPGITGGLPGAHLFATLKFRVNDADDERSTLQWTTAVSPTSPDVRPVTHESADPVDVYALGAILYTGQTYTVTVQARDPYGAVSNTLQWRFTITGVCGNGTLNTGEQCDLGANNGTATSSCSSVCQFDPKPNLHMDCYKYDLPVTGEWSQIGQDAPSGDPSKRIIFPLQRFGEGYAFTWQSGADNSWRHTTLSCTAHLNQGAPRPVLVTSSASGLLRVEVQGVRVADSWHTGSKDGVAPQGQIPPTGPLGAYEVRVQFRHVQGPTGYPIRPQWVHAAWLPVSQDRWTGLRYNRNAAAPNTYSAPLAVSSSNGPAALVLSQGGNPQFYLYLAGEFTFAQTGRYAFNTDTPNGILSLYQTYANEFLQLFRVSRQATQGVYQLQVDTPGPRPLFARYVHNVPDTDAHMRIEWARVAQTASCGNGVREGNEQCDHGGTPSSRCNAYCEIPDGSPVPACGDRLVQAPEECDPPASGSCSSTCRRIVTNGCNNNGTCQLGETAATCAADCGANAPRAREVNNNPKYGDLTTGTPRVVSPIYFGEGPTPDCSNSIVVSKMDWSSQFDSAAVTTPTIAIDGQGANGQMGDQVWCGVGPGVHEVSTTNPPNGFVASYSVCVGCRSHPPDSYQPGARAQVYVPDGSYASVRFGYGEPGRSYNRLISRARIVTGTGEGGGASVAPPPAIPNTLIVNRPIVVGDGHPALADDGFTAALQLTNPNAAGGGAGSGYAWRSVTDERPTYSLELGASGDMPVRWVRLTTPKYYGSICHVPVCTNGPCNPQDPMNDQNVKECWVGHGYDTAPVTTAFNEVAHRYGLRDTDPANANIRFRTGRISLVNVGGTVKDAYAFPDAPLPGALEGATTSGTRPSLVTYADMVDGSLKTVTVLHHDGEAPWALNATNHYWIPADPPRFLQVLSAPYECDTSSVMNALRSCPDFSDLITDLFVNQGQSTEFVGGDDISSFMVGELEIGLWSKVFEDVLGEYMTRKERYTGIKATINFQ